MEIGFMQDYERMINHFFHHFNVTIISPYQEKKHYKTDDTYSISYILKKHPLEGHVLDLMKFNVEEYDNRVVMSITYSYGTAGKFGLSFDGNLLKEKMAVGIKCLSYLDSKKIMHYCPTIKIKMSMNTTTKKIKIKEFYQCLSILSNYSYVMVFLEDLVTEMVDAEFKTLNEDVSNVSLIDKLDLLAMEMI